MLRGTERGLAPRLHIRDRAMTTLDRLKRETEAARGLIEVLRCIVGDDKDMIATAIDGETNLREAVESAANRITELEVLEESGDAIIDAVKARSARFSKQRELLKEAIAIAMETAGEQRIELAIGTFSLKATPQQLEVTNEAAIPAEYWKPQEPKLDRKQLLKDLRDGKEIPGVTLDNGGQTLQVKRS